MWEFLDILSITIPFHSRVTFHIPVPVPIPELHHVHSYSHGIPMKKWEIPICMPRTLGPSNAFTLLNGWICLHGVLD